MQIFIILNYHVYCSKPQTDGRFVTVNDGVSRSFCQANELCATLKTIDKKYCLLGFNYPDWLHGKNYSTGRFWTSLVNILPEVASGLKSKLDWRDGNYLSDSVMSMNNSIHERRGSLILEFPKSNLMPNLLSSRHSCAVVCELIQNEMQTMSTFKFIPFSSKFTIKFINTNHQLDSCYTQFRSSDLHDCLYRLCLQRRVSIVLLDYVSI
ncbi:unnamed protein product [Heterobilharzia americana]|nr:unnamed protein product [Heterobilharzia americana]